jgi:hypothetical protein
MRPLITPQTAWGGDPHLKLRDERTSFAYDTTFKWGAERRREIEPLLADNHDDGREPWPSETHRRLSRTLRMWLSVHRPHELLEQLLASQVDTCPWRQLVEDLAIAAQGAGQ